MGKGKGSTEEESNNQRTGIVVFVGIGRSFLEGLGLLAVRRVALVAGFVNADAAYVRCA